MRERVPLSIAVRSDRMHMRLSASNTRREGGSAAKDRKSARRNEDQRVVRTRSRIDVAFVELLHRRGYGDIRIGDITKKAGVGRPTFYAHYSGKDDLLRSQFERIVAPMLVAVPDDPALLDASPFFAHIRSAPQLYRALMGPNGGSASRVLRDCFESRVRNALSLDQSGN